MYITGTFRNILIRTRSAYLLSKLPMKGYGFGPGGIPAGFLTLLYIRYPTTTMHPNATFMALTDEEAVWKTAPSMVMICVEYKSVLVQSLIFSESGNRKKRSNFHNL